ncbi:invasin [Litoribrevibacter albus]|uniref:Invasin n=2 Tax=Litoribrevibacter albus TaxID=1473156 RepID=A0AA37S8T6_9GAMM|nr:invasin [Litoribrevibacter albus]
MLRCGYQSLFYILFAWILAACGGGGGGGVDPNDGNIGGGSSSSSVDLVLQDSAGNPIVNISDASSAFLVASLSGSNNANRIVNFSLTEPYGRLNPSSGRAVTNSSGVASIQIFAGTEAGAGTAAVVVDTGAFDTTTYNALGDEGDSSSLPANATLEVNIYKAAAYTATPQSKTPFNSGEEITRDVRAVIEAQLSTTSATESVEGFVISFSTDLGVLNQSTALTDSNGIAYVILSAGDTAGAGTATATISGVSKGASFATAGDDVDTTTTAVTVTQDFALSSKEDTRNITTTDNGILTVGLTQGSALQYANVNVTITGQGILEYTFPGTTRTITGQSLDVITDSNGQAVLDIIPGSISGNGSVVSTYNGENTSNSINFNIIADEIQFGAIVGTDNTIINNFEESVVEIDTTSLSAGSTTVLEVAAIKGDSPATLFTESYQVSFTSSCISAGNASVDSPVTAISGIAVATYTNISCTGNDVITANATIGGQPFQATRAAGSTTDNTAIITTTSSSATSLSMTNITETLLALKNTSGLGRSETSDITFTATDSGGNAVPSQTVNFELTTDVGGITFSPASANTNANGQVTVTITSGTVPTPVRVKANMTVGATTISTVSEQLNIGVGLPDQDSFSQALESFAVQAYNGANVQNTITLSAADHFGNPVVSGTTFTVIADKGGRVGSVNNNNAQASCEVTNQSEATQGSCTLTWLSSGDNPDVDLNRSVRTNIAPLSRGKNDRFGRTNVLAYAIGEETFYDSNGNGVFDVECSNCIDTNGDGTLDGNLDINGDSVIDSSVSEAFDDMGEPFADINEDGVYTNDQIDANDPTPGDDSDDITEAFVDFNSNLTYDGPDGLFNGALCSQAAIAEGHCASLTYVWDEDTFVISTDDGIFYIRDSDPLAGNYEYEQSGNPPSSDEVSTDITNLTGDVPQYDNGTELVNGIELSTTNSSETVYILITDNNGNNIPAGSEITFTCSNCDVTAGSSQTASNSTNPSAYSVTLARPTSVNQVSGQLSIEYQTPDGTSRSASYTVVTPF